MLKRFGISFCVLLAFASLQAHNFIAHHHDDVEVNEDHHLHDHDHHDDNKANHHNSPFNDISHTADFGKVIPKPDVEQIIFEAPIFFSYILTPLYNKLACFKNSLRPHPPDKDSSLHIIFLSHSLPLRAPPASYLS